ncbi:MAG TPA: trypsin-like peptidase domain-containing protein [Anaeromyxobacteraceae bacterium]|nr:trypsin-like peptidase domain-containing protein [Anaeromyxobacteraceae bacterium]
MPRRWFAWVALAAWFPIGASAAPRRPAEPRETAAHSRSSLPELSRLARTALPAVVGIITTQGAQPSLAPGDPLNEALEQLRGEKAPRRGLASGFIVQADGYILTNAHVVEGVTRVEVELGEDGERLPARVVGLDEASDVALVKVVAGRRLPTLPLGDSDRVQIAEWVMVMGNPFGLAHTVTVGIVSHTGRSDVVPAGRDGYYDFIQTDASINPGSSGGPILNLRGEVVGIATAINATGQGIGFAVPINMAKEILPQLREHGRVLRSWMGVSVRELRLGASRGLRGRQVVVTDVVNGSPAATSGLAVGDVITGFDGRGVPSAARLRWYVATAGVGRHVALTVRRGAAEHSVRVALVAEAPGAERTARAPAGGVAAEAPRPEDE